MPAMNDLSARVRASLVWVLPLVAVVLLLGLETEWGSALRLRPPPPEPIAPKPVPTGLLPEYTIEGGLAAHTETVNRTLFNPTRRPAPAAAEAAKQVMKRGQFALTGTTVAGDRALAFLKETGANGKPRTVRQGETINGMLVAEVKPDRVKLTLADEAEELMLKVATNPKPTPQPVQPPQPGAPAAPGARPPVAAGAQPGQAAPGQASTPQQSLAERRRAARAAEAAAAAARQAGTQPAEQPATPFPVPQPAQSTATPAATGQPQQGSDSWSQVYQRYQQRRQK